MRRVETGHFVKGMHTLLNAHFNLRNFQQFQAVLKKFEAFSKSTAANTNDNFRIHTFIYIHAAKINWHLMTGGFTGGLALIPHIEANLAEYSAFVDGHRILVFNYKIAMMYFGSGDYK